MNNIFNTIKGIGKLKYKNIYGFYDEPLMFSCYSATGSLYFLLRLPSDDEQWLAVEVSKERLELLESNLIEARVPFVTPESGYLYRIYSNDSNVEFEILTSQQLTDDMLPYSGEYLDYNREELEYKAGCEKYIVLGKSLDKELTTNEKLKSLNFRSSEEAQKLKINLAKIILTARREKHISQKQLSEKTGITQADISRYESGEGNPTLDTIYRIAYGLGMTINLIFENKLVSKFE